jgi:hypothetical protein
MKITIRKLQKEDFKAYTEIFEQVDKLHRDAHPEYFHKTDNLLRTEKYFENLLHDSSILLHVN